MTCRHASTALGRVLFAVTALLVHAAPLSAQNTTTGVPVPSGAAQAKALELIREVYEREFNQAKTSSEQIALAKKLFQQARESNDATNRFVLLRVAREMATLAGEAELALQAIDEMARVYQIDAFEMKKATIEELVKSARSAKGTKALARNAVALIDEALAADEYDLAGQLGVLALAAARNARDGQLVKQIVARNREVEKMAQMYAELKEHLAALDKAPTDPGANLAVGKYYCLTKGDWERGLPMLALGGDPELKTLALRELEGVSDLDGQVSLGDGWWDLSEKWQEGRARDRIQGRAGHWYRQALPRLAGLARAKVEKRLEALAEGADKTLPAPKGTAAVPGLPEGAVLLMTFNKDGFFQKDGKPYAKDFSGRENHGVIHGATLVPGKAGAALYFDGKDDYVDCGNAESLSPTKSITVCAWIMARSWKSINEYLDYLVSRDSWPGGRASERGYVLRCARGGHLDFTVANPNWTMTSSAEKLTLGQWYHVVGTYDGSKVASIPRAPSS